MKEKKLYYIYGDNESFVLNKIDEIFISLSEKTSTNKVRIGGNELDEGFLNDTLMGDNLFGETTFLIIERIEKSKKQVRKHFKKLVEDGNFNAYVVVTSGKKPISDIKKLFNVMGEVISYKYPKYSDILHIVNNVVENKNINRAYLKEVFELTNKDINKCIKEYEKIDTFLGGDEDISKKDFQDLTSNLRLEESIFSLTKNLNSGNTKEAMEIYEDMLLSNENAFVIMSIFLLNIIRLLIVKRLMRRNADKKTIARTLGIPDYFLDEYLQGVKHFSETDLLHMIEGILVLEHRAKTGLVDIERTLFNFIVENYLLRR